MKNVGRSPLMACRASSMLANPSRLRRNASSEMCVGESLAADFSISSAVTPSSFIAAFFTAVPGGSSRSLVM